MASPSPIAVNEDSETVHFVNYVASKMKKYDTNTKNAVQRGIMEIIFKADEGLYTVGQSYTTSGNQQLYSTYSSPSPVPSPVSSAPGSYSVMSPTSAAPSTDSDFEFHPFS